VLSINRPGYGGNTIPKSEDLIVESMSVIAKLINNVYHEGSNGSNGIVLIGHSLGAAIALGIAAFECENLPLLGVSALGIIPTKRPSVLLETQLKEDPNDPRIVMQPTQEVIETYLGPPSVFDQSILKHPSMPTIFEPGRCSRRSFLKDTDRISSKVRVN
jgi:pimeloyl-ACP methyl ester carboxylesterase